MNANHLTTKDDLNKIIVLLTMYLPIFKNHLKGGENGGLNHNDRKILTDLAQTTEELLRKLSLPRKYITFDEALLFLGISPSNLYKKMSNKQIPYYKPDHITYFDISELTQYIEDGRIESISETDLKVLKYLSETNDFRPFDSTKLRKKKRKK